MERPLPSLRRGLDAALAAQGLEEVLLRAEDLGGWDSSLLSLVTDILLRARESRLKVRRELPEALEKLIRLAFAVPRKEGSGREKAPASFLVRLGGAALALPAAIRGFLEFLGDVALALLRLCTGRSAMRGRDLLESMYECGVASFSIVAITNLLFGLILAFVGALQLISFGAQIYVAGLVGIGMLRVMGAIMVGVVMSGRIGASYAALLGTMQVNEEVDALEAMGISPMDFLVVPRLLALALMVPLLTVFADLMGMAGGFLVGITILDLTPGQYVQSTLNMVHFHHGLVGLLYASVYGVVIALFGCYHGMRCARSAQGVGQATTTAVVHSLVGIIVSTAIITILCNALKI